jgi:nucleoside-diphosphate-sugar epimerase/glutathionylspermidine synthase
VDRVRQSLSRFTETAGDVAQRPFEVLVGDLTDGNALRDARLEEVTHVLHIAGETSFRSSRRAQQTNVTGTLALAQRMRNIRGLVRFVHVGTAYICGARPPALVHETDHPRDGVRHLVEYTRSKAECELLLQRDFADLPLVVARPSVVVGHTQLGCGPSASIFWYYRAVDILRRVPAPVQTRKDIVPVDYVAKALLFLLFNPSLRYRCYHISAGEAAGVSWAEMADVFARCGGRVPEAYDVADFASLTKERARLQELLGAGDENLLLRALEPFFQFSAEVLALFDNRRLLSEGMPAPPRFTDYLPLCIASSGDRGVYQQLVHDVWGSAAPPPWRCGEPLTPDLQAQVQRRGVFECCKWNTQVDGQPLVCSFPLILDGTAWQAVVRLAANLARETLAAEQELLRRPDLHRDLGLPRTLMRWLRRTRCDGPARAGPRVMRFDFHWTVDGWRISEANTDVAGGFVEASGISGLVAENYPGYRPAGDPADVLSEAVTRCRMDDRPVGLLHQAACLEDRQTMLYLARRLQERNVEVCLLDEGQLKSGAGRFEAHCDWYRGPLSLLIRFLPADSLRCLPRAASPSAFFAGSGTPLCNPGYAILTQSKRFPLVWERMATQLPTWRSLLPETHSPGEVPDLEAGDWVIKPALGHEGHDVRMRLVTDRQVWQGVVRTVRRRPGSWVAQRCFFTVPVATPDGLLFPCLGVYVIDGRVAGCYGRMAARPVIDDRSREVAVLVKS